VPRPFSASLFLPAKLIIQLPSKYHEQKAADRRGLTEGTGDCNPGGEVNDLFHSALPSFDTVLLNKKTGTYHIKAFEYPFNLFFEW
jgi:hypothetical protein